MSRPVPRDLLQKAEEGFDSDAPAACYVPVRHPRVPLPLLEDLPERVPLKPNLVPSGLGLLEGAIRPVREAFV